MDGRGVSDPARDMEALLAYLVLHIDPTFFLLLLQYLAKDCLEVTVRNILASDDYLVIPAPAYVERRAVAVRGVGR